MPTFSIVLATSWPKTTRYLMIFPQRVRIPKASQSGRLFFWSYLAKPRGFYKSWTKLHVTTKTINAEWCLPIVMDQVSIKTPNPSLLVFNRLEIKLVMMVFSTPLVYWRPSNLLTDSSTPPPFPVWISTGVHVFIQPATGGRDRGPQTDKHLPPSTFTGQFLRKAVI
jgi:hypothetical protein